jgi:hypothetical protein
MATISHLGCRGRLVCVCTNNRPRGKRLWQNSVTLTQLNINGNASKRWQKVAAALSGGLHHHGQRP